MPGQRRGAEAMKNRTRVIDRILHEAAETRVRLPFERGAPRRALIAARAARAAREAAGHGPSAGADADGAGARARTAR